MTEREQALKELEKWFVAETVAKALEAHGILPITQAAMRTDANLYRENLLLLMGVDETPAATMEIERTDLKCW